VLISKEKIWHTPSLILLSAGFFKATTILKVVRFMKID